MERLEALHPDEEKFLMEKSVCFSLNLGGLGRSPSSGFAPWLREIVISPTLADVLRHTWLYQRSSLWQHHLAEVDHLTFILTFLFWIKRTQIRQIKAFQWQLPTTPILTLHCYKGTRITFLLSCNTFLHTHGPRPKAGPRVCFSSALHFSLLGPFSA